MRIGIGWRALLLLALLMPALSQAQIVVYPGPGGGGGGGPATSVTGPVLDQGGAVYNVVAYGADPTGATDSTSVFTSLLGHHIYVPEGTFLVGRLIPTSGTTIECAGWNSIIKLPNNSSPLANNIWIGNDYNATPADNVVIKNCRLNGNKGAGAGNTNGSAISLTGVNTLVAHNYIHDAAYACVVYGKPSGSSKAWILNNWCHNPSISNLGWGGFGVVGGSSVTVEGNYCTSADSQSAYCVDVEPNNGWTVDSVVVRGNVGSPGGLWLRPATGGTLSNVIATGNYATSVGTFGGNPGCYLLTLTGNNVFNDNTCVAPATTHAALQVNTVQNTIITGNKLIFPGVSQVTNTLSGAVLFANATSNVYFGGNSMLATGRSSDGTPFCINEFSNGATLDVTFGPNEATDCQMFRSQPAIQGAVFKALPQAVRKSGLTNPTQNLTNFAASGDLRNILLSSDVFNGTWTIGSGLAVTDNNVTDPVGTTTAARFVADATGNPHTATLATSQATVSGDWWNLSLWLKATSGTPNVTVTLAGNTTGTLATQVFGTTTTWRRVEIAGKATGTDATLTVTIAGAASADFAVWRAVLAPGMSMGAPVKTSGAAAALNSALYHAGGLYVGTLTDLTGQLLVPRAAGAAPTVDGDVRFDTTRGTLAWGGNQGKTHTGVGVLSAQVNGDTNNSSSGSGSNFTHNLAYTFPANFFLTGKVARVTAVWRVTTGSAAPAMVSGLGLGGTAIFTHTASTPGNNLTAQSFTQQFLLIGAAAPGPAANVVTSVVSYPGGWESTAVRRNATAQPVALATNGALALTVLTNWATAGTGTNTAALDALIVEALN